MTRTKTCTCCRQSLPFSRFDCSATSKDGFSQKCKNCAVLYNKKPGPKRIKIKVDKDQLAWHPGSKKDLTDYQRLVIAGKQHGGFKRDPKAVPPRTFLWSSNTYWQEKPAYVRDTGNQDIKSRGV